VATACKLRGCGELLRFGCGFVADSGVETRSIVEAFDEAEEGGSSGRSGLEGFILHQRGLDASEEAFRGGITPAIASPAYRAEHAVPGSRPPPPHVVSRWH
jgi:hypothetical protein